MASVKTGFDRFMLENVTEPTMSMVELGGNRPSGAGVALEEVMRSHSLTWPV